MTIVEPLSTTRAAPASPGWAQYDPPPNEGHFFSLPGVRADHVWDPSLIHARSLLEQEFMRSLRGRAGPDDHSVRSVREALLAVVESDDGPSLSLYMERSGTIGQMRQAVIHRSAYQLKEGDAHSFAIPRLAARAKQILLEIQAGEYGADAPGRRCHSALFADTMEALGLDSRPHLYLECLPASTLMLSNVISMFSLNRAWRGALVGHLGCFEMTSVTPMGRYSNELARMGAPHGARKFYEVHVVADAELQSRVLDMAEALVECEPDLHDDVVFGARRARAVEALFAGDLFRQWRVGEVQ